MDNGKTWRKSPESDFSIRTAIGYQEQLLAVSWHNGLLLQRPASAASAAGSMVEASVPAKNSSQQ